ncbi:MAG: hypothetical protein EOM68_32220 [Spirochaetia bacterium]|nr:hypothetical protein [Spirochaetia bacterium]
MDLRKPIMFVGGAGVGKTQLVKGKLGTLPEEIISLSISFNYFTDVISFQKVCAHVFLHTLVLNLCVCSLFMCERMPVKR